LQLLKFCYTIEILLYAPYRTIRQYKTTSFPRASARLRPCVRAYAVACAVACARACAPACLRACVCAACVRTPIFTILFVPHALFLHLDTTLSLVGSCVKAWRLGVCICRSFIHLVQSLNTFSVRNILIYTHRTLRQEILHSFRALTQT
jgi:hypothetical protein